MDKEISEYEQITGHKTPELLEAWDKGYTAHETVMMNWLERWDGGTNSALGELLMRKYTELKDKIDE